MIETENSLELTADEVNNRLDELYVELKTLKPYLPFQQIKRVLAELKWIFTTASSIPSIQKTLPSRSPVSMLSDREYLNVIHVFWNLSTILKSKYQRSIWVT